MNSIFFRKFNNSFFKSKFACKLSFDVLGPPPILLFNNKYSSVVALAVIKLDCCIGGCSRDDGCDCSGDNGGDCILFSQFRILPYVRI